MARGVLLLLLLLVRPGLAEVITHARFDRNVSDYTVNSDLTYTQTQVVEITLLTRAMVTGLDRLSASFYPDKQRLSVVEAWVDQPDGSRVQVPPAGIATRQSQAAAGTPGFISSMTTTVLFPQLREGSRLHVMWRRAQIAPALLGFNVFEIGALESIDIGEHVVRIALPEDVPLRWGTRGNVTVQDDTREGMRRITATLPRLTARLGERASVSPRDYEPVFVATSLPDAAEIGARIWRASKGLADPTPRIAALAAEIAGERTGIEAARAIHAWVVGNIRYVAVYLNPDDGYVPHAAEAVLAAGYGDCKDYTVLMQALLAARGIRAEAAILNWGTEYAGPPLLTPAFANHEIVYLPDFDLYLNPTDRNAPFGALDRRLAGKTAIRVTPTGVVTETPASTPAGNRYRYRAQLTLDADGTLHGRADYAMAPATEIGMRAAMAGASSLEDLARRLLTNTREGGTGTIDGSDPRDLLRPLRIAATWDSPDAVNRQGDEVFLSVPQGMDLMPPSIERQKLLHGGYRRTPVLADAVDLGWENEIALPAGMRVEKLPEDVDLRTPVGSYSARYRATGTGIAVSRNLVVDRDVVAGGDYAALKRLLAAPIADARAIIALRAGE